MFSSRSVLRAGIAGKLLIFRNFHIPRKQSSSLPQVPINPLLRSSIFRETKKDSFTISKKMKNKLATTSSIEANLNSSSNQQDSLNLNQKILAKHTIDSFCNLILSTPNENFDYINCSAAIYTLGKLKAGNVKGADRLQSVHLTYEKLVKLSLQKTFPIRSTTSICNGVASAHLTSPENLLLTEKLFQSLLENRTDYDKFDSQAVSNILWSFASMRVLNTSVFERIFQTIKSVQILEKSKVQELTTMLWSIITLEITSHPEILKMLFEELSSRPTNQFSPQSISQILWSATRLKTILPELRTLLTKIYKELDLRDLHDFDSDRGISAIIYQLGQLGVKKNKFLENVIIETKARGLSTFSSQGITSLLVGFSKFGKNLQQNDREIEIFFQHLADEILNTRSLQNFSPRDLTILVFAFARVGVFNGKLFVLVREELTKRNMKNLKKIDINMLVYNFAKLNFRDPQFDNLITNEYLQREKIPPGTYREEDIKEVFRNVASIGDENKDVFQLMTENLKKRQSKQGKPESQGVPEANKQLTPEDLNTAKTKRTNSRSKKVAGTSFEEN